MPPNHDSRLAIEGSNVDGNDQTRCLVLRMTPIILPVSHCERVLYCMHPCQHPTALRIHFPRMATGGLRVVVAHLGCQANYLSPTLHPQVRAHDPTDSRAQHLALVVQQYRRVVVEPHQPSVRSSHGLSTPHDDGASHVTASHLERVRDGLRARARASTGPRGYGPRAFHDADDLVADAAPAVVDLVFEHVDTFDEQRTRVVYDLFFFWLSFGRYAKVDS